MPKNKYYDIESPVLEFYTFTSEHILFQFNEPVISAKFLVKNDQIFGINEIKNIFPVANIRINKDFFNIKMSNLIIESQDTAGNNSKIEMTAPVFNRNPAGIEIEKIRIGYTKKEKQSIGLRIKKSGNLYGFYLVLFVSGEKIKILFDDINVKKSAFINIYISKNLDKTNRIENIDFEKKYIDLYFKNRLSEISSLIYIVDNENKILDYFLYYNTKKHPAEYYNSNNRFNKYKCELEYYNIEPEIFDVAGTTSTRVIVKVNGKYMIKKD